MKGCNLLGPALRSQLKRRLVRIPAFEVTLRYRCLIRTMYRRLEALYPGALQDLRILPINSAEWTSEIWKVGSLHVVVFDCEQCNALDFLQVRSFGFDRPIFHYNEYAVRASELLLATGQMETALRVAQANHGRLREYVTLHGNPPYVPRPIAFKMLDNAIPMLECISPAFLFGHEIGHF